MADIDSKFDALQSTDSSQLSKKNLALMIQENYKELLRSKTWPKQFSSRLKTSLGMSKELVASLKDSELAFSRTLQRVKNDCRSCHDDFRDGNQLAQLLARPSQGKQ